MTEIQDLDALLPDVKKIKISGKILNLYPGKLKSLIRIQKAFLAFQDAKQTDMKLFDDVINALAEIIPDLKRDDVDISMEQIPVLVSIAYTTSIPKDAVTKDMTPQKKTG